MGRMGGKAPGNPAGKEKAFPSQNGRRKKKEMQDHERSKATEDEESPKPVKGGGAPIKADEKSKKCAVRT